MKCLVLGGTRFFGKRLVELLVRDGCDVTLATRGKTADGFGNSVKRVVVDRDDRGSLKALPRGEWDVVYDQIGYSPDNASHLIETLSGRVGRLLFTSTQSVYDLGAALTEGFFYPFDLPLKTGSRADFSYMDGKRYAEAAYFQKASFPVCAVRLPFVLGLDDYTGRLEFHIDHIRAGKAFYLPSVFAKLSLISSADAAWFLLYMGKNDFKGPINAASPECISLGNVISLIEEKVGKKAVLGASGSAEASPFGIEKDWYMNVSKAEALGFRFTPLNNWLPELIIQKATGSPLS